MFSKWQEDYKKDQEKCKEFEEHLKATNHKHEWVQSGENNKIWNCHCHSIWINTGKE